MNYFDARPQIENGDHIAVLGTDLKAKIIAFGQRWARLDYPYAKHSGIAYWENNRLMLAQINGTGNNSVYMSQIADHEFVVSKCPVAFDREQLDRLLETHFPYFFVGLVLIGVRLFFSRWFSRFQVGSPAYTNLVCSSFSIKFYQLCGWSKPVPKYTSPAENIAALEFKFKVTP